MCFGSWLFTQNNCISLEAKDFFLKKGYVYFENIFKKTSDCLRCGPRPAVWVPPGACSTASSAASPQTQESAVREWTQHRSGGSPHLMLRTALEASLPEREGSGDCISVDRKPGFGTPRAPGSPDGQEGRKGPVGSQRSEDRIHSLLRYHPTASPETQRLCGEAVIPLGSFKNCIHFICFVFSSGPVWCARLPRK